MAYEVFQFGRFSGGLNLRDKADVVQDDQAIDLLNVDFTDVGAVKQRDGYVELTGTALTNRVDSLWPYYKADGTKQLLAGCGTRLEAISTAGAVVASATGLTGGPWSFVRFAAPGSEFAYAGNGTDTLRKWDGSSWTAPTATVDGVAARAMPEAGSLCVMANSNRLVATAFGTNTAGGPHATASNPSRVYFSDAGSAESWTTTNWIDLHPGDGEKIMAAVTWRDRTFIFKQSKFFVITSDAQLDATGAPIFDYYAVDTGIGLAAPLAFAVARSGIYFMALHGVYYTNGSDPQLLSEMVEPIFHGSPSVYFTSNTLNFSQIALARMGWHDERLYLAIPTGSATANDRILVYDLSDHWWSLYDIPASALVEWQRSSQDELHFGYATGGNEIGYVSHGSTDDNGTVITSRWRAGWGDYGTGLVKRVRETKMWGSGGITVKFSADFNTLPDQTADVPFGSATALWPSSGSWQDFLDANDGVWPGGGQISAKLIRKAVRGTVFSTEFTSITGSDSWSVHRVSRHLADQRIPSVIEG